MNVIFRFGDLCGFGCGSGSGGAGPIILTKKSQVGRLERVILEEQVLDNNANNKPSFFERLKRLFNWDDNE